MHLFSYVLQFNIQKRSLWHAYVLGLMFLSLFFCQIDHVQGHEALRVYELDSTSLHDVLFSYSEGKMFFGTEDDEKKMIYKFKRNKLYRILKGKEDCLYTFTKFRLYRGDSTDEKDCLFTFYQGRIYNSYDLKKKNTLYTFFDGQVFRGYSHAEEDVLYTIKDRKIYRGAQTEDRLYYFKAKKNDWYRVYYNKTKQPVFTFTRLTLEDAQYACSRMKYIRMLGLIDFLSLGLIDSPWSMVYFALQMNDAVANCID